jgi:hypothetical protein
LTCIPNEFTSIPNRKTESPLKESPIRLQKKHKTISSGLISVSASSEAALGGAGFLNLWQFETPEF